MKNIFKGKAFNSIITSILIAMCLMPLFGLNKAFLELHDSEFINMLRTKVQEFKKRMPEDRVYMHFDKSFYRPGETIWFSGYVRDGENLNASTKSDILHVELINPKGGVDKHIKMVANNGQASGDFQLDVSAPGGLYKIKAYTTWQNNEHNKAIFEKTIQVQDYVLPALKMKLDFERKAFGAGDEVIAKVILQTNENKPLSNYSCKYIANLGDHKLIEEQVQTDKEGIGYFRFKLPKNLHTTDGLLNVLINYEGTTESISRSIPIVLNKINFTMYPEGGDLVANLPSRIAFKALNEFGKPADVEGVIIDSKGDITASFSSYYMGMGAFNFKPVVGEIYTAKITNPEGIDSTFQLPNILSSGFILNVDKNVDSKILLNIHSTIASELSLLVQIRGKIYYSGSFNAQRGLNKIEIPTKDFPIGTAQITLFDSKGIASAERLVFVNKQKQLNISVVTDKEKYLPREKVKMTIKVKDDKGDPVSANLSLSVVDDQLLSFADDRSGNILSQLLLEQDINTKVEEAAFYFNPKEAKADKALDFLLMTSGWRRFTWKEMLAGSLPAPTYAAEQAVLSGFIYDGESRKPIEGANVSIGSINVKTDKDGRYTIRNTDPVFPMSIQVKSNGYNDINQYAYDYSQNQHLYIYSHKYYNRNNYSRNKSYVPNYRNDQADFPQAVGVKRNADIDDIAMRQIPQPAMANANKNEEVKAQAAPGQEKNNNLKVEMPDQFKGVGFNKIKSAPSEVRSYYRTREFAAPVYDKEEQPELRSDFRSTIYWNGNVAIDNSGEKAIEFYNSDNITSFRTTVEGLSTSGGIGHTEQTFYTQLPFSLRTKLPIEVVTGDIINIPLTLKNNTSKPLGGIMKVTTPVGFALEESMNEAQTIMPGNAKTIYAKFRILPQAKTGDLSISFKSCGLSDAFTQTVKVITRGFPVQTSFSGQELDKEFSVTLSNVVEGSVNVSFSAYPSVVNDLVSGIEGILREPYGCFEQTSTSSYPNAMVLDYMKSTDTKNEAVISKANRLLEKGYARLTTFETSDKGYEWFGSAPGHEALTAYGLMQFADMQRVGAKVDQKMMDRTAAWLMSRSDGNGGFKQNQRALDNFGRGGTEITNSYITYALAEAGYKNLNKELDLAYQNAMKSNDPYLMALTANAMYRSNDPKRGDKMMEILYPLQAANGSWTGKTNSITHSTGISLTIETTSLTIMAILKQQNYNMKSLTNGVQFIVNSRSGNGTFGNTQGTVLALKALTAYSKASRKTASGGTIEIHVHNKKVAEYTYTSEDNGNIEIKGLEQYINSGKNKIKVKYKGTKEALPYTLAINWNTSLPVSSDECALQLNTSLSEKTTTVGGTNRLSVILKNIQSEAIPNPIAIIGIPAGFTAQPWQLKEIQEKGMIDFYEVKGNNIVLYFRSMVANETKNIYFDLKAELSGEFDAPASCAYLYYTNEFKVWKGLDKVSITASK